MDLSLEEVFAFLFPILFMTWVVYRISHFAGLLMRREKFMKPAIVVISVGITLFPFGGLSLAEYILSVNPVYSIGSIALFFSILWKEFRRKDLLSRRDILWFSIWNVALSLFLFSSSLGLIGYDLYAMGYRFSVWFLVTALLTILLFMLRSPLAYIFTGYIIAFDLKLFPSDNFFDYITDGILFLISLGLLMFHGVNFILQVKKHGEQNVLRERKLSL